MPISNRPRQHPTAKRAAATALPWCLVCGIGCALASPDRRVPAAAWPFPHPETAPPASKQKRLKRRRSPRQPWFESRATCKSLVVLSKVLCVSTLKSNSLENGSSRGRGWQKTLATLLFSNWSRRSQATKGGPKEWELRVLGRRALQTIPQQGSLCQVYAWGNVINTIASV